MDKLDFSNAPMVLEIIFKIWSTKVKVWEQEHSQEHHVQLLIATRRTTDWLQGKRSESKSEFCHQLNM